MWGVWWCASSVTSETHHWSCLRIYAIAEALHYWEGVGVNVIAARGRDVGWGRSRVAGRSGSLRQLVKDSVTCLRLEMHVFSPFGGTSCSD